MNKGERRPRRAPSQGTSDGRSPFQYRRLSRKHKAILRRYVNKFETASRLADQFNVSVSTIRRLIGSKAGKDYMDLLLDEAEKRTVDLIAFQRAFPDHGAQVIADLERLLAHFRKLQRAAQRKRGVPAVGRE